MYVYKYFVSRTEMIEIVKEREKEWDRKRVSRTIYVQITLCQIELSMNVTNDEFKF